MLPDMHCSIWNCRCSLNNKISQGTPHFGKLKSYWFLFFISPVNFYWCKTIFTLFLLDFFPVSTYVTQRRLNWCPFKPQEGKQSANEESDILGHDTALQDSVVRRKRTLQSLATFFSVGNCFLFFNCFWPRLSQISLKYKSTQEGN